MSTQKQGRPRDSRVDHAIATALVELLTESGYARLTMDAVAERARVGKAGIYRRYATKQEMIFAILTQGEFTDPDLGSLRADLSSVLDTYIGSMAGAPPGTVVGLLADIEANPALKRRFLDTYTSSERRTLAAIVDRAIERGEITRQPDVAVLHAALVGPLFAWLFLLNEPADQLAQLARGVLESVLKSLD